MATTPNDRPPTEAPTRMRTTRPATLVVAVLGSAAVAWLVTDNFYGSIPRLPWLPPLTMLGLGLVELVAARQTRARIERRRGAAPVEPLLVARYVVLAKASALAGALFGGFYAGMTVWLGIERTVLTWASENLPAAVGGTAGSFALVGAALLLERACRVPPPPPGSDPAAPGWAGSEGARDDRGGR